MKTLHQMAHKKTTMRQLYIMLRLIDGEPEYIRQIADEFKTNTRSIWYVFESYPELYERVDMPAMHLTDKAHGAACRTGIRLTEQGQQMAHDIINEIEALKHAIVSQNRIDGKHTLMQIKKAAAQVRLMEEALSNIRD